MNKKIKVLLPFITSVFAAILVEQNLTAIVKSLQTILNPAYSLTILTTTAFSLPIFTGIVGVANLIRENTIKKMQIAFAVIFSNAVQLILTNKISNQEQLQISKAVIYTGRNTLDDRQHEHRALSWSRLITVTTTLAVTVATLLRTIARNKQTLVIEKTHYVAQNPTPGGITIAEMTTSEPTPASKATGRAGQDGGKSAGTTGVAKPVLNGNGQSTANHLTASADTTARNLLKALNAAEGQPASSTPSPTSTKSSRGGNGSGQPTPPLSLPVAPAVDATLIDDDNSSARSRSTSVDSDGSSAPRSLTNTNLNSALPPMDPSLRNRKRTVRMTLDPRAERYDEYFSDHEGNKTPLPTGSRSRSGSSANQDIPMVPIPAAEAATTAVNDHSNGSKKRTRAKAQSQTTKRSNSDADVTMEPARTDTTTTDEMQEPPKQVRRSTRTTTARGR